MFNKLGISKQITLEMRTDLVTKEREVHWIPT